MTQPFIGQGVPKDESSIPRALSGLQHQINELRVRRGSYSVFPGIASQAAMLALAALPGDMALRADVTATFVLTGNDPTVLAGWVKLPSASGHTVQDEGTPLTTRGNLNFVGSAVTATDDSSNNATVVTVDAVQGSLGATKGDMLIYYGGAWHVQPVGADGSIWQADSTQASGGHYAAIATTSMNWRGTWTYQNYAIGDVVKYLGKLYVCKSSIVISSTGSPSYVGSGHTHSSGAAANITLPAGAQTSDIAVVNIGTYRNAGGNPTTPAGFTAAQVVTGGTQGRLATSYKVLTSTDASGGVLSLPAQTFGYAATVHVFRAAQLGSAMATSTTLATTSVTPANSGYVLSAALSAQTSAGAFTQASLSGIAYDFDAASSGMADGAGYEAVIAGVATTSRTWTVANASAGFDATSSVTLEYHDYGLFDYTKWDELADEVITTFLTNAVAASGSAQVIPDPVLGVTLSVITLTANCTVTLPAATAGARFRITFKQDGTGSRTVTYSGNIKYPAATQPTLTTTAGHWDKYEYVCEDGTNWELSVIGTNYS